MASRSKFPAQIDQFIENTEIDGTDIPLLTRYQDLKLKLNRTPQEDDELASLLKQLFGKLMTAEDYNQMKDSITATQKFFRDNVDGYIQQKQTEFQTEIDKFKYNNTYSSTVQYVKNNTVTYNGETYLCLKDSKNNTPDPNQNTAYWAKIAAKGSKGDTGAAGTGLAYKGTYSASVAYSKNDAVTYQGQIYGALQNSTGQEPSPVGDTAYWSLAVTKGASTKVATFRKNVYVSTKVTNVAIGISEFNATTDVLIVTKNSTILAENENYKLNANGISIDSLEGDWDGTVYPICFHFIVFKNFVSNDFTYKDGSLIQDGTISKAKLNTDLKNDMDTAIGNGTKLGDLTKLVTKSKDTAVNAINEVQQNLDTHASVSATTNQKGHVQLSDATNSTSSTTAATSKALKTISDRIDDLEILIWMGGF